jgi:hypothetical protein
MVRACGRFVRYAVLVTFGSAGVASAQVAGPEPPGPYVIELRGAIAGIPSSERFYPRLEPSAAVPARGFGVDAGAHLYPLALGVARVGFGVNVMRVRGSVAAPDVQAGVTTIAPQISFNFGTRAGWSHLSAGYGAARVTSTGPVRQQTPPAGTAELPPVVSTTPAVIGRANSGLVGAINYGGGARWFLSSHVAAGFDLRFHRLAAGSVTPSTTIVALAVGLSVR